MCSDDGINWQGYVSLPFFLDLKLLYIIFLVFVANIAQLKHHIVNTFLGTRSVSVFAISEWKKISVVIVGRQKIIVATVEDPSFGYNTSI